MFYLFEENNSSYLSWTDSAKCLAVTAAHQNRSSISGKDASRRNRGRCALLGRIAAFAWLDPEIIFIE